MSTQLSLDVQLPHHGSVTKVIRFDRKSTIAEAQNHIESVLNSNTEHFALMQLKPERWLDPSRTFEFYSLSVIDTFLFLINIPRMATQLSFRKRTNLLRSAWLMIHVKRCW